MVLHTRGRVGRRHFNYISGGFLKPDFGNPPFFVYLHQRSRQLPHILSPLLKRPAALRRGTPVFLALSRLCFSEWGCCYASPELSFLRLLPEAAECVVLFVVTGIGPYLFPSHIFGLLFYGDMYVVLE